jgi:hypothetical protein
MFFGFKEFIGRWLHKASGYNADSLDGAFDKFVTLYTVFNILYDEAFSQLVDSKKVKSGDNGERRKAVTHIAAFLEHDVLKARLRSHSETLSSIMGLIRDRKYYFSVKGPQWHPNFAKDAQLLRDLQSDDAIRFSEAVLILEYRVRCNLLHGLKGYDSEQMQVIVPMTELLEEIINVALSKLGIAADGSC